MGILLNSRASVLLRLPQFEVFIYRLLASVITPFTSGECFLKVASPPPPLPNMPHQEGDSSQPDPFSTVLTSWHILDTRQSMRPRLRSPCDQVLLHTLQTKHILPNHSRNTNVQYVSTGAEFISDLFFHFVSPTCHIQSIHHLR